MVIMNEELIQLVENLVENKTKEYFKDLSDKFIQDTNSRLDLMNNLIQEFTSQINLLFKAKGIEKRYKS